MKNSKGFTLVELMVVVAIIGILSAVAVPNFKSFQAKAKTSEAKLNLAGLYSAEVAFSGDYDVYATCLLDMGYEKPAKGYYVVGFATGDSGTAGEAVSNGAITCNGGNSVAYVAPANPTKVASAAVSVVTGKVGNYGKFQYSAAAVTDGGNSFIAAAEGVITKGHTDSWAIDNNKQLLQTNRGW